MRKFNIYDSFFLINFVYLKIYCYFCDCNLYITI